MRRIARFGDRLKRYFIYSTHLQGADLVEADLSNANLQGAYLGFADLSRANLQNAYLACAIWQGACTDGAYFQGSKKTLQILQVVALED